MLEVLEAAEVLPIRVFQKMRQYRFVALVEGVLQIMKPHHQADRIAGSSPIFDISGVEFLLKMAPVNLMGENEQGVPRIEDLVESGSEQIRRFA